MTGDAIIGRSLWVAAAHNTGSASLFAIAVSCLGQLDRISVDVPLIYKYLLALHGWTSEQTGANNSFKPTSASRRSFAIAAGQRDGSIRALGPSNFKKTYSFPRIPIRDRHGSF
jgi:hypothetical protein